MVVVRVPSDFDPLFDLGELLVPEERLSSDSLSELSPSLMASAKDFTFVLMVLGISLAISALTGCRSFETRTVITSDALVEVSRW